MGVVKSRDLEEASEEEICANPTFQCVASVRRIKVGSNNEHFDTFNTPSLPQSVKARYLNIPGVPYSEPLAMLQVSHVWTWAKYLPW